MNVIISMGRNIGEVPMDASRWAKAQHEIWGICGEHTQAVFFRGVGDGVYMGVKEEAYTVIALLKDDEWSAGLLELELSDLAEKYGQDAIAVTYGEPRFVGPVQ